MRLKLAKMRNVNREPKVVSIAAWSASRAPGARSDVAAVPSDGRCRQLGDRTPGHVRAAVRGANGSLQFNPGRIVQFKSRGSTTSHGDPADTPTQPTSGTAA